MAVFLGNNSQKSRLFFLAFLTVFFSLFLFSGTALAVPGASAAPTPATAPASDPSAIPPTFDVGDNLTAPGQEPWIPTDPKINPIVNVLIKAIDLLVKLIASVSLLVFIIGALLTIVSEGKEDRLEKGKSAMLYAILGLIISLFAFIIVTFVQSILF